MKKMMLMLVLLGVATCGFVMFNIEDIKQLAGSFNPTTPPETKTETEPETPPKNPDPPYPPCFTGADPSTATRALIDFALGKMCDGSHKFKSREIMGRLCHPSSNVMAVGLEAWNSGTPREIHVVHRSPLEPAKLRTLPPLKEYAFDLSDTSLDACTRDLHWPYFYIARNPSKPALELSMMKRLRWICVREYEFINFGDSQDIIHARMDWIRQYAAADHEFFKNGFNPHNFAELTAFHFLDTLAHSNHTRAVYLETDAVPVFGFRHKFTGFLRQLEAVMPAYDIAFLGTCCDLEKHVRLYDAISPNIHLSRGTRCFNAVLITREAARRVLAHGALSTQNSLWAIDHLFIVYIQDLPLHSLWASEPLFYEESKIPTEYICP